jgi:hypothetical protein
MCPACIASAAAMAAGAGSTGGMLAMCIGKFKKFFKVNSFGLLQKTKEKSRWQRARRETLSTGKGLSQ